MFDINGWELIVLAMVAVVVLGPERLPVYAAKPLAVLTHNQWRWSTNRSRTTSSGSGEFAVV